MTLTLIGLGIFDEGDLTLRGVSALECADEVYAEFYTSIFSGDMFALESIAKKKITVLTRSELEDEMSDFVKRAKDKNIALLVVGDPMVATTHTSIVLEAKKQKIRTKVIHSSSIFSAVAETGLHIYKFGKTASIPYPEPNFAPVSFYDILSENKGRGEHTLMLLDIKADKEKYMTVGEAIEILLNIGKKRGGDKTFTKDTLCIGLARLGSDSRKIIAGTAEKILREDFGQSPHALIVPGDLHFTEREYLERVCGL